MENVDPSFDIGDHVDAINAATPDPNENPPPLPDSVAHFGLPSVADGPVNQTPEPAREENISVDNSLKDRDGNAFNAELHATDENGDPKLNKDGTLQKKRGRGAAKHKKQADPSLSQFSTGTVSADSFAANQGNAAIDPAAEASAQAERAMREETAKTLAQLTEVGGVLIGGQDFVATDKERQNLAGTYDVYMQARGVNPAMSPEAVLIAGISGYVIPRLNKPEPKKRFKIGWLWVKDKFQNTVKRAKFGAMFKRAKSDDQKQERQPRPEELTEGGKEARDYKFPLAGM
jgi:hypothetical protein